ncbi:hypothetical protein Gohar_006961, partial [Gossypium harknessii]|nr:hypothetical protein [Gossypium harknessii]
VFQEKLALITTCIGFKVGRLPVRYLGVPLVSRKLSQSDCVVLTNRILGRFHEWSTKNLSYAGTLQLIKVVIFSVQAYWSHQFLMLKSVLKKAMGSWRKELAWAILKLKGKSLLVAILKLAWSAYLYVIWRQRNKRYFGAPFLTKDVVLMQIKEIVRAHFGGIPINRIDLVYVSLYASCSIIG